jgi:hypothetical protein
MWITVSRFLIFRPTENMTYKYETKVEFKKLNLGVG